MRAARPRAIVEHAGLVAMPMIGMIMMVVIVIVMVVTVVGMVICVRPGMMGVGAIPPALPAQHPHTVHIIPPPTP